LFVAAQRPRYLLIVGRVRPWAQTLSALGFLPNLEQARNYLDAQFGRDARQGPTPFSVR